MKSLLNIACAGPVGQGEDPGGSKAVPTGLNDAAWWSSPGPLAQFQLFRVVWSELSPEWQMSFGLEETSWSTPKKILRMH